MRVALIRTLWFTLTAFVLIVLWEVLTFELPREPRSEVWNQWLLLHTMLVAVSVVGSLTGALLGFGWFPGNRSLPAWRVAALGAVFALVMFFALGPLIVAGGFVSVFVGALVLAAIVAQLGGRALAGDAA